MEIRDLIYFSEKVREEVDPKLIYEGIVSPSINTPEAEIKCKTWIKYCRLCNDLNNEEFKFITGLMFAVGCLLKYYRHPTKQESEKLISVLEDCAD